MRMDDAAHREPRHRMSGHPGGGNFVPAGKNAINAGVDANMLIDVKIMIIKYNSNSMDIQIIDRSGAF